eukprot:TRINITY_DN12146_c0_g1_i1.p1 TRINITY_DN12146_c0_g1~~TRINITY_DN12146_c0_g1_i1.p1  ORF type:complete len:819 (+),score=150.73 TRINITY_DN12146_c0_g1_i1:52-2508(+)
MPRSCRGPARTDGARDAPGSGGKDGGCSFQIKRLAQRVQRLEHALDKMLVLHRGCVRRGDALRAKLLAFSIRSVEKRLVELRRRGETLERKALGAWSSLGLRNGLGADDVEERLDLIRRILHVPHKRRSVSSDDDESSSDSSSMTSSSETSDEVFRSPHLLNAVAQPHHGHGRPWGSGAPASHYADPHAGYPYPGPSARGGHRRRRGRQDDESSDSPSHRRRRRDGARSRSRGRHQEEPARDRRRRRNDPDPHYQTPYGAYPCPAPNRHPHGAPCLPQGAVPIDPRNPAAGFYFPGHPGVYGAQPHPAAPAGAAQYPPHHTPGATHHPPQPVGHPPHPGYPPPHPAEHPSSAPLGPASPAGSFQDPLTASVHGSPYAPLAASQSQHLAAAASGLSIVPQASAGVVGPGVPPHYHAQQALEIQRVQTMDVSPQRPAVPAPLDPAVLREGSAGVAALAASTHMSASGVGAAPSASPSMAEAHSVHSQSGSAAQPLPREPSPRADPAPPSVSICEDFRDQAPAKPPRVTSGASQKVEKSEQAASRYVALIAIETVVHSVAKMVQHIQGLVPRDPAYYDLGADSDAKWRERKRVLDTVKIMPHLLSTGGTAQVEPAAKAWCVIELIRFYNDGIGPLEPYNARARAVLLDLAHIKTHGRDRVTACGMDPVTTELLHIALDHIKAYCANRDSEAEDRAAMSAAFAKAFAPHWESKEQEALGEAFDCLCMQPLPTDFEYNLRDKKPGKTGRGQAVMRMFNTAGGDDSFDEGADGFGVTSLATSLTSVLGRKKHGQSLSMSMRSQPPMQRSGSNRSVRAADPDSDF